MRRFCVILRFNEGTHFGARGNERRPGSRRGFSKLPRVITRPSAFDERCARLEAPRFPSIAAETTGDIPEDSLKIVRCTHGPNLTRRANFRARERKGRKSDVKWNSLGWRASPVSVKGENRSQKSLYPLYLFFFSNASLLRMPV